jgi:anthranilate phosphoribosyltransferase
MNEFSNFRDGLVRSSPPADDEYPLRDLRAFVDRLRCGDNLSRSEAAHFLECLLTESTSDEDIATALLALAEKGETVEELVGIASGMRARAVRITCGHDKFLDTAGTGSSHAKTFNVSTAAALVISATGLPVAKHGNRGVTSVSGSSDVLSELGVAVAAPYDVTERCLNELGICFMFAPAYHGTTARVAAVRRELGVRTVFNLLGPLTNPAGAPFQLVGVSKREFVEPLARALAMLGTTRAWVVHGSDGLDEVTLDGVTTVAEASPNGVSLFELRPEDFGLKPESLSSLECDHPKESALIIQQILSHGRRDCARDLVIANAAAGLVVAGVAEDLHTAASLAAESIDSGAAASKLAELVRQTNE